MAITRQKIVIFVSHNLVLFVLLIFCIIGSYKMKKNIHHSVTLYFVKFKIENEQVSSIYILFKFIFRIDFLKKQNQKMYKANFIALPYGKIL
jgi:hypothetical protein